MSVGFLFHLCLPLSIQLMKRNPQESHVFSTLVAGGVAGLSGWAVAIPMDVVKNRHQGWNRAFFETDFNFCNSLNFLQRFHWTDCVN